MAHRTTDALSRCLRAGLCFLLLPFGVALAEPVTLAVVGDSNTGGYGLDPQDGFIGQLDLWLRENGAPPVAMRDLTGPGRTTTMALSLLERDLDDTVDAMIVQLGGSDMAHSIEGGATRAYLRDIVALAQDRAISVLLIGDFAPETRKPAVRQEYDTLFAEIAAESGVGIYPSFYHAFGRRLSDVPKEYLQLDRIHPTADAVRIIVEDIGPVVLDLVEGAEAGKQNVPRSN